MSEAMRDFLRQHNIHEVECVIADMTGIARGKILPKDLFLGEGEIGASKTACPASTSTPTWRWPAACAP